MLQLQLCRNLCIIFIFTISHAIFHCVCPSAIGLYWAERQSEIEKWHHNVTDSAVNAAVLADLQQKQEVDFARCLDDMAGKVSTCL